MGKATTLKRSELDIVMRSVANVVQAYVKAAVEPLIERIAELEARKPEKGEKGEPGRDGKDGIDGNAGKDGTPGRDGIDGKDGRDGIDGKQGEIGAQGPVGRDGRDGQAGRDGKDGEPGKDGRDGVDGKDGAPGLNGKDGFNLSDFNAHADDDGRALVLAFGDGETRKEFRLTLGTSLYRGVFQDGHTYERGDQVTWAGSQWHCNVETSDKPGDGSKNWTLSVKKGRDGKDGAKGPQGERGPQGLPGLDRR